MAIGQLPRTLIVCTHGQLTHFCQSIAIWVPFSHNQLSIQDFAHSTLFKTAGLCLFLPMVRQFVAFPIIYHVKKSHHKRYVKVHKINQILLKQFSDSAWKYPIKFIQISVDTSSIFSGQLHLTLFL